MKCLTIITYHRVLPEPDPFDMGLADRSWFERQLDVVGRMFDVLPLHEAVPRLRDGALRRPSACITFDDGYADNESVALDVLRSRGMPATFFIAAGYLDGGCMWNDLVIEAMRCAPRGDLDLSELGLRRYELDDVPSRRAATQHLVEKLKYLDERERTAETILGLTGVPRPRPMMTSRQVERLHLAGMEIGGHTLTHPILKNMTIEAARREIEEGKRRLEQIIGTRLRSFAYPNGRPNLDYGMEHVDLVQNAGFEFAVSTAPGVATRRSDVMQLPRVVPWPKGKARLALEFVRNAFRSSAVATDAPGMT